MKWSNKFQWTIRTGLRMSLSYCKIFAEKISPILSKQRLTSWSKLPPFAFCLFSLLHYIGQSFNLNSGSSFLIGILLWISIIVNLCVILLNAQDMLLYHPNEPKDARITIMSPAVMNLPYESLTITTSDNTHLHAFLIKQNNSRDVSTVIMLHGNAGNIGHRLTNTHYLYSQCNVNVLMLEYRGYGLSGGEISEAGLYDDALSAIRYAAGRPDLNATKIVLHGRSLGGAVAIYVAAQPECANLQAIILENTFTSLPGIAHVVLNIPVVKMLPTWCYKNRYPSDDLIKRLIQPTLFLTGRSDKLVPPRMMDKLHALCGSKINSMSSFPNGTHNETFMEPGYFYAIAEFLGRLNR